VFEKREKMAERYSGTKDEVISDAETMAETPQSIAKNSKVLKIQDEQQDDNYYARAREGEQFGVEKELENSGESLAALAKACDTIQAREKKVQLLMDTLSKDKNFWTSITDSDSAMDNLTETGKMICEVLSEKEIRKLTPMDFMTLSSKAFHSKTADKPILYFRKCYENLKQGRVGA